MTKAEEINKNLELIAQRAENLATNPGKTVDESAAIRQAYRIDIEYIIARAEHALRLLDSYPTDKTPIF